VPLYERIALYSVADGALVTATRDGMNLVPYEYIVCRQGMKARRAARRPAMRPGGARRNRRSLAGLPLVTLSA